MKLPPGDTHTHSLYEYSKYCYRGSAALTVCSLLTICMTRILREDHSQRAKCAVFVVFSC